MNSKALGKRIQKYRNENKLTAEKFAEMVGLSTSMIREIERGNKLPSLPSLVRIANSLNVSADELLCDSVEKTTYVLNNEITENLKTLSTDDLTLIKVIIDSVVEEMNRRNGKNYL